MNSTKNCWCAICLFVLVFILASGCAPDQATEGVEPSTAATVPTAESTTTPQPTGTPIPTAAPKPTDTPEPTAAPATTLTPYQVWEATCMAEGAQYVDVPFGPQEDGGPGVQQLAQLIDGSLFTQDLIPDCYMLGAEIASPMTQQRAAAWQLIPDASEPPGNLEIPNLPLPQGTYKILLKNVDGGRIQLEPTPDPWFKLFSPFPGCDGDVNPVVWVDGSFNAESLGECAGEGGYTNWWGHNDTMPPLTCMEKQDKTVILAPASGFLRTYSCNTPEPCFKIEIDNGQYLTGLHEALAFSGMPERDIDSYIEEINTGSFGGVSLQFGHVNLYPDVKGRVEAGQPLGETAPWAGTVSLVLAYQVYTTNSLGEQYQISPQLFPMVGGEKWVRYPKDGPLYNIEMNYQPISHNYPPWCKSE